MNVSRSALLPYNVKQMYDVIADIRSYPDFLNWCSGAHMVSESREELVAKLVIAYGKLKFSFTTRNIMFEHQTINMSLVEGPFSTLSGQWVLQELSDSACKVSLEMDFHFESIITQKLFGRVFQSVIAAQLDAFQNRAEQLYGASASIN
ncbi:MAG: ribosome-associated toxin RatA of RatAB toxin-antitoxin module [Arenicella sp.]|jgi:ribosome-associated toxin RatA of RatAB toxin-antitoxin module